MTFDLPRRLAAEALGTGLLVATVVGSGIMADNLAGGNVALALLGNTLPTGAIPVALHCVGIGDLLWPEPSRCGTTTLTQSEPRCTPACEIHGLDGLAASSLMAWCGSPTLTTNRSTSSAT